jgi:predicted acylesterase/phospholipase RssA
MIHALVLSGGGAKGAREAGSQAAIIDYYKHTASPITILSGTSVGALNAAGICSKDHWFPMDLWLNISQEQVYKSSRLLLPWRLWKKSSIYDSSPLWKLIQKNLDLEAIRGSEYQLMVHALDLFTGQQVTFTNEDPDLLVGVYASAAVPGAFPPIPWKGTWLVDGGTVANTPIRSCIKAGAEKITVIYLDDELPKPQVLACEVPTCEPIDQPKIVGVISKSIEAMMDRHFRRDLQAAELINAAVTAGTADPKYRHVDIQIFKPPHDLGDTLDFDRKKITRQVLDGYHDAVAWVCRRHRPSQ